MLAQAIDRVTPVVPKENIFIITNAEQREAVLEVCPEVPAEQVVGEPMGRDTAAAVGLAGVLVRQKDPNGVFAILPADHVIDDIEGFGKTLELAFEAAESGDFLVTIGIEPTEPATGYGYIQKGQKVSEQSPVFKVKGFVEKPDLDTAKAYLQSGEYAWNAGMFVWQASHLKNALAKYVASLSASLDEIEEKLDGGANLESVLNQYYPGIEKISIDFALMEKADNVLTIPAGFDWDDVGEWPAIARHYEADDAGNVSRGLAVMENSGSNIVYTDDDHLVALLGVEDLIVVRTEDATLVCRKDQAQQIKGLVGRVGNLPNGSKLV